MAEILNIHNPEHTLGEVDIIRQGMMLAFQQIVINDPYGPDELKGLFYDTGDDDSETDIFSHDNPHEVDLGMEQERLYLLSATSLRCGEAVDVTLSYLSRFSEVFECYRHTELELTHFDDHAVGFVHSKLTDKWYAFSPANAFNEDDTLPTFAGKPFQRINSIICADSYAEVVVAVASIEGGTWPLNPTEMLRGPRNWYDISRIDERLETES